VLQAQSLVALNKPSASDYRSVEGYIFTKQPLVDEESAFIYRKEDLITLRDGREMAMLDNLFEKVLRILHCSFLQVLFQLIARRCNALIESRKSFVQRY
jgi:hypothetical protein